VAVKALLSDEQGLLQESVRHFLDSTMPTSRVREVAERPSGLETGWWAQISGLGVTGVLVAPEFGGTRSVGIGAADLVIVAQEFARTVAPGPVLPANVVAMSLSAALEAGGNTESFESQLAGVLDGTRIVAWCHSEPGRHYFDPPGTVARRAPGGWELMGSKNCVEAATFASDLVVTAMAEGTTRTFVVPADTTGVRRRETGSLDLVRRYGRVDLDQVFVPADAEVDEPAAAGLLVRRQLDVATLMHSASMVGAASAVFDATLQFMGQRFTFGRPISSYQALKHRVADMRMWLEACQASLDGAAEALDADSPESDMLVSVAKALIGDKTVEMIQDCIQIHGGIGVTWEHDLHLFLRRASVDRALGGSTAEHQARIADLLGA
jgi:alkylation response protein AidB-like acyl-CoA dehydrogenase